MDFEDVGDMNNESEKLASKYLNIKVKIIKMIII